MLHRGREKDHAGHTHIPGPLLAISGGDGSLPAANNPHPRSSTLKFFASSSASRPAPSIDPQKAWTAEFLTDLRSNRPARPTGSRPLPERKVTFTTTPQVEPSARTTSAMSRTLCSTRQTNSTAPNGPDRCSSAMSHRRAVSTIPPVDGTTVKMGRSLVQQPHAGTGTRGISNASKMSRVISSGTYVEREQRWMEKQEARSLREALEDMDLQHEQRLHAAAQEEASELVWKHQNPEGARKSLDTAYRYQGPLDQGSHVRSQSLAPHTGSGLAKKSREPSHRSIFEKSALEGSDSKELRGGYIPVHPAKSHGVAGSDETQVDRSNENNLRESPKEKSYMNITFPMPPSKTFSRRRSSGPKSRNVSGEGGKGLFRNPNDQIYEEPEELVGVVNLAAQEKDLVIAPLKWRTRNSSSKIQFARDPLVRSETAPVEEKKRLSRFEIHRNPPSQSRNPSYVRNALPPTPPESGASASDSDMNAKKTGMKNNLEIRSDDIRTATSMRLKDRSPKLHTPTAISNGPGRPIVSFDQEWRPREIEIKHEASSLGRPSSRNGPSSVSSRLSAKPRLPESIASAPLIPTISFPEPPSIQVKNTPTHPASRIPSMPLISVSSAEIPTIAVSDDSMSSRPLPDPVTTTHLSPMSRPLPHHSSTAPIPTSTTHWSQSQSHHRATAQCAACALPISGRIVSAATQRFHPHCFTCFQCGELLECVAFYPEPDSFRSPRLDRIQARENGVDLSSEEGKTWEDDGDDGLRFYCHLDFHEKFSPRCRSCKTPIEGEVVVACGGEWHVGHFFCAECGDPFDANTPFVEKDGNAEGDSGMGGSSLGEWAMG
ncbi:hypothetical protein MMC12_000190 [Toensbergia leucococca]|nr:hypothetical protein [Toensbergia leucococca]